MTLVENDRWPLLIRLIHWSLALSVVLNLFVVEEGDAIHRYLGYFAAALVVARFVWGLRSRQTPVSFHNSKMSLPRLVYFAIWSSVILLALTGWMMGLDRFWGNETLETLHSLISDALLVLVVAHLGGIALDAYRFKRKTWMRMINGSRH